MTAPDELVDFAAEEHPKRYRYLISDGRTIDVVTHRVDGSGVRGDVLAWLSDKAKKAGVTKEERDAIKIEGAATLGEPGLEDGDE